MNLIDIGANLTHNSFDADRDQVIEQARLSGVGRMILTGASEQGSRDALILARQWPNVLYATAGVHPHHASDYTDDVDNVLRDLQEQPEVVAVGECGLDYFRNFSPVDAQRQAFQRQLELAIDNQLPVFLHQRDAHDDFMEILTPAMARISRAVAHCFTGTEQELRDCIDLGLYVGITGWICDERRGAHLKEIVALIPADRLMIETDAPYLLPRTLRPKPKTRRNEPRYLPEVLRAVADSMDMEIDEVASLTTRNAERFFGLS